MVSWVLGGMLCMVKKSLKPLPSGVNVLGIKNGRVGIILSHSIREKSSKK
jgi:hypothetical protein